MSQYRHKLSTYRSKMTWQDLNRIAWNSRWLLEDLKKRIDKGEIILTFDERRQFDRLLEQLTKHDT